ncbi:MAG TPA: aspartate aminotransferase family protein [Gaiella sp.]|nr:aspartate aminotransferase family protein [Gaiella sp.]
MAGDRALDPPLVTTISGAARRLDERLPALMRREEERFAREHPRSRELAAEARRHLLGGVPMHWMAKWPGGFPVFFAEARGSRFTDVDGHEYVDFCLGDTGAMSGHAPAATLRAIAEQSARGITTMLPTDDALWVAEELSRRFGVGRWQFALTATDANRFSIRLARHVTGRPKVLVFDGCYHGTVDETFATLSGGRVVARRGNLGPPVPLAETTKVVEWNDRDGLEAALAPGDVALVLTEPALTNLGIVHPEPGFHDALRRLTRDSGTWLAIDETHTICCGPGGYTRAHGLTPDVLTIGKPIAGGIPAAAYGFADEPAEQVAASIALEDVDVGGVGGTLAANALSVAAMRATLANVLTHDAFARMIPLAERWAAGVEAGITEAGLPWHVTRLGCRAEYLFGPDRPRNGTEAHMAADFALERFMHLHALNRGVLLTPFHNMALMSPATTERDVDRHTEVFREAALELAD